MCSAGGYKAECETHREKAEPSVTTGIVVTVAGTFLMFLNFSHLLFVINISEVMKATRKYLATFCK